MEMTMLCGLPTSGKSTYVNDLFALYPNKLLDTIVLSTDYYVENYAKAQGKTYNDVFAEYVKESHRMMYRSLEFAIENKKNIIWDQTNIDPKTRSGKLNKIPVGYSCYAIYFPIGLSEALERNQNRPGKIIPEHVIQSMHNRFVPPTTEEGFLSVRKYEN